VIQFAVMESWVKAEAVNFSADKTDYFAIIALEKQDLSGHKLRHKVIA
jgi:hypothetical protein|tara:strand:- start:452 stop:595 length:144 start_codon:yes stop_codon:yes gene_type:complete